MAPARNLRRRAGKGDRQVMIATFFRRLLAACRVLAGRSPFHNHRRHDTEEQWTAQMQATLAEGYHLQHGFCPHCGAYSLAMVWPGNIGRLGECPQCHTITTTTGSAIPKNTGDLSPAAMAERPPFMPMDDLRETLEALHMPIRQRDLYCLWRTLANRLLAHYDA